MHKYMQVQSYLCQLGVEDLKVIAKDLGCNWPDRGALTERKTKLCEPSETN